MKLTLRNFRCYTGEKSWTFSPRQLNLLHGVSGQGKSTLLSAIFWCLYGSLRNIKPLGDDKAITEVTFELSGLVVRRISPSRLHVTQGASSLQGDDAQRYIQKLFGSRLLWLSGCYSQQDEKNPLITASGTERFDILKEITFGDTEDSPDSYLERIDSHLSSIQIELAQLTPSHQRQLQEFKRQFPNSEVFETFDISEYPSIEELKRHGKERDSYIRELQPKIEAAKEVELKNKFISEQNKKIQDELSKLPFTTNIEELESELEHALAYERYIQHSSPSSEDVENAMKIVNDNSKRVELYRTLNVVSLDDELRELKKQHQSYIEREKSRETATLFNEEAKLKYQKDLEKYHSLLEKHHTYLSRVQEKKLHDLHSSHSEKVRAKIASISLKIEELKPFILTIQDKDIDREKVERMMFEASLSQENLTCPACESCLEIREGRLVSCVRQTSDLPSISEIQQILDMLSKRDTVESLSQEMKKLELELSEIPEVILTFTSPLEHVPQPSKPIEPNLKLVLSPLPSVEERLSLLESLPPPIPKHEVEKANKLLLNNQEAPPKVDKPTKSSHELKKDIENERRRKYLVSTLRDELPPHSPSFQELMDVCSELREEMKQYVEVIHFLTSYSSYTESFKILQETTSHIEDLKKREGELVELRGIVHQTSIKCLDDVINQLNMSINNIISTLFEDPISVLISSSRELKNKKTKNEVNVKISYKGCDYDGIHSFSGGERDRLSLGFTIAISLFSSCEFLLLDECMASLDGEMRDKCVEAIKLHLPSKTVINICHEIVEGTHDASIQVS